MRKSESLRMQQQAYKTTRERQQGHKCYNCMWARWSDMEKATCMFPRCFNEVNRQKYTKK